MDKGNDRSVEIWLAVVNQALRDYRGESTKANRLEATEFLFPHDQEGKENVDFVFWLAGLNADSIVSKLNQREAA